MKPLSTAREREEERLRLDEQRRAADEAVKRTGILHRMREGAKALLAKLAGRGPA